MRARMAIASAGTTVALREVLLRDKPAEMLRLSPKGTVPVLLLADGEVIDESLDIMHWALQINDPERWLPDSPAMQTDSDTLITRNDGEFKTHLDHYKYAVRHPEHPPETYRDRADDFLGELENRLRHHPFLLNDRPTLTDIAIFPFIRQFAFVDHDWFDQSPYPRLQAWLTTLLGTPTFSHIMVKQPVYTTGAPLQVFP